MAGAAGIQVVGQFIGDHAVVVSGQDQFLLDGQ